MNQLLLDALWHITSDLSVSVVPTTGARRSVANLEGTAPDQSASLPADLAAHVSGPALR